MTRYEYIEGAYNILLNDFSEKRIEFIESKIGLKGEIFCSFVNFITNYLSGFKYCNSWIDEIDEECVYQENISYEDALYNVMKYETGVTISHDLCKKILTYLKENKNNISGGIYGNN